MLTVHEDERQKEVALRAAYHAFVAMFLGLLAAGCVGLFILEDDALGIGAMLLLLVAICVYHVSLWRGGWFEYVREVANRTHSARTRARRQAAASVTAMTAWLFVWSYAFDGDPPGRALLGSIAGGAVVGALVWLLFLRRLPPEA